MAATLAKRVQEQKERHSAMLARARDRATQIAKSQQHTVVALGAAYLVGELEKRAVTLPTVQNIDPKLLYGAGAMAIGYFSKDKKIARIAQSVGDGMLAIVAYNQGKGVSPIG